MESALFHFIKKEFIQFFRDPRMLYVAFLTPLIQILAFGYIASTDIKNVSTVIFDEDRSSYSRSYIASFGNSGYFEIKNYAENNQQVKYLLDSGQAKLSLHIPAGFKKKILRGETAPVQAILDGTNASNAMIILGYIDRINFQNSARLWLGTVKRKIDLVPRVWYNPELKSIYYMVPAIFAMVLMLQSMLLTSFSIVKEKERGTMEQLIVTPLKPYELILGKILPFILVAFFDVFCIFLLVTLWFKVPLHGSAFLLFSLSGLFLAAGLGIGVFISTISHTQRQAMMAAIFIISPSLILSGFVFPIANMPLPIQSITYFIPLRYFLVILRGIFLKGIGLKYLWNDVWPLMLFAVVTLTLSVARFRKKID